MWSAQRPATQNCLRWHVLGAPAGRNRLERDIRCVMPNCWLFAARTDDVSCQIAGCLQPALMMPTEKAAAESQLLEVQCCHLNHLLHCVSAASLSHSINQLLHFRCRACSAGDTKVPLCATAGLSTANIALRLANFSHQRSNQPLRLHATGCVPGAWGH